MVTLVPLAGRTGAKLNFCCSGYWGAACGTSELFRIKFGGLKMFEAFCYSPGPKVPDVLEFCGYTPDATGAPAARLSVGGIAGLLLNCTSYTSVPFKIRAAFGVMRQSGSL